MLNDLSQLRDRLLQAPSLHAKICLLDAYPAVQKLLVSPSFFRSFLQGLTPECEYALKQLAAIGQLIEPDVESTEKWRNLLASLLILDQFYREIGGIVGYQVEVLKLIAQGNVSENANAQFHSPQFDDISQEDETVKQAILAGIEAMPLLAELYPLGGAADRLHLVDEYTGQELPAAKLQFAGRSLLETLVRDLQAREWLYFRLYGRQITTPIAIMSSWEKGNCGHVTKVFEEHRWFGRPSDSFRFFVQPLVPAFDGQGDWHSLGPLKPVLKPGGHGVIWKLARDEGIFEWLKSLGCKKALLRQINNPIAGLDYGLIAFSGIGCSRNMAFGFASCDRLVQAAEGVVVLVERPSGDIVLTNVEYCDFEKFGIEDKPLRLDHPYSRFSSNTNILFADLEAVENAVATHPFPGLLMNLKPGAIVDESGVEKEVLIARLESTMQNIADAMPERKGGSFPLKTEKTFVVRNKRHKTISVAKKAYQAEKSMIETPELCFYELLRANAELLVHCGLELPAFCQPEEYIQKGPSVLFLYHPALGPLYSIIQQKVRGGQIADRSELIIEAAEVDIQNLSLSGSLQIQAKQVLGAIDEAGILRFSDQVGRVVLHNVHIENKGVDWTAGAPFWKMNLNRFETVQVELNGWSEFDARDVHFTGAHKFVVEEGVRMTIRPHADGTEGWTVTKTAIADRFMWNYCWNNGVELTAIDQLVKNC